MRKGILFIVMVFCFFIPPTQAQLPKASDYFPLQIGNVWQYDHPYQTFFQLFHVIRDTIIGDSVRIYQMNRESMFNDDGKWIKGAPFYYHYNQDSTMVYRDIDFPETPYTGLPVIDTGHGIGHRIQYLLGDVVFTLTVTDTGTAPMFGQSRPWLEFGAINPDDSSVIEYIRYVAGIGPTEIGIDTLVYAKINGMEYGTPFSNSIRDEQRTVTPDEFSLNVYPNPVTDHAVIVLENLSPRETEISIIDIRGRTVRTIHNPGHDIGCLKLRWNGKDRQGNPLANGIYFVVVRQNNEIKSVKFNVLH